MVRVSMNVYHTGLVVATLSSESTTEEDDLDQMLAISQKIHDHNEKLLKAGGDIFKYQVED